MTTLVAAHERILSATNPASPVHALNVPETCGGCHSSQLEAFRTSRHSELASQGIPRAPTCLTCHGAVAARFPSTQGLEGLCASCHGPNGPAPRSAYQSQVRLMRDLIDIDRYQLALARAVLPHVANAERREALEAEYRDAEDLLDTAVASWHSFTFETAAEPLAEAGRAISGLVERLTAP